MNDPIEQDLQPPQNVEIPDQLPLLPVRDIVIFPYMVLPLLDRKSTRLNSSHQ